MEAAVAAAARAAQAAVAAGARWAQETTPRYFKHFFGQNAASVVVDDADQLPPSRCRLNKITRKVKEIALDGSWRVEESHRKAHKQEQAAAAAAAAEAAREAAAEAPGGWSRWLHWT